MAEDGKDWNAWKWQFWKVSKYTNDDVAPLMGVQCPVLQMLTLSQTSILYFFSKPGFWKLYSAYQREVIVHSTERCFKHKMLEYIYLHILLCCSCGSLRNHNWFQTVIAKIYTSLQTKLAQNLYILGWHMAISFRTWIMQRFYFFFTFL